MEVFWSFCWDRSSSATNMNVNWTEIVHTHEWRLTRVLEWGEAFWSRPGILLLMCSPSEELQLPNDHRNSTYPWNGWASKGQKTLTSFVQCEWRIFSFFDAAVHTMCKNQTLKYRTLENVLGDDLCELFGDGGGARRIWVGKN